jgi:hypothetical protein
MLDAAGPNMGCIHRGITLLEYFFSVKKVLVLIEEISASVAPDFILKAHFFMTVGAIVIGTHIITRSASLAQLSALLLRVTFSGGFQRTFLSYARTLVSDFLEKYLKNHEPILPPAPIIDIIWTISISG